MICGGLAHEIRATEDSGRRCRGSARDPGTFGCFQRYLKLCIVLFGHMDEYEYDHP